MIFFGACCLVFFSNNKESLIIVKDGLFSLCVMLSTLIVSVSCSIVALTFALHTIFIFTQLLARDRDRQTEKERQATCFTRQQRQQQAKQPTMALFLYVMFLVPRTPREITYKKKERCHKLITILLLLLQPLNVVIVMVAIGCIKRCEKSTSCPLVVAANVVMSVI